MEVTVSFLFLKQFCYGKQFQKYKKVQHEKIMILISVIFDVARYMVSISYERVPCSIGSGMMKKQKGDHLVYIREGHELVPFLVLTSDYNGETLLLRKEVLKK